MISVLTSRSRDAPTSRLGLGYLRLQDVILPKLVWIKGTEYCTDFLSLSEQGDYAWSRRYVIAPYNLIVCIIIVIINGRENKVTTEIIITCRPRSILTSRLGLVSKFERLVSCLSPGSSAYQSTSVHHFHHSRRWPLKKFADCCPRYRRGVISVTLGPLLGGRCIGQTLRMCQVPVIARYKRWMFV